MRYSGNRLLIALFLLSLSCRLYLPRVSFSVIYLPPCDCPFFTSLLKPGIRSSLLSTWRITERERCNLHLTVSRYCIKSTNLNKHCGEFISVSSYLRNYTQVRLSIWISCESVQHTWHFKSEWQHTGLVHDKENSLIKMFTCTVLMW